MKLLTPSIFDSFPEVIAAMSLREIEESGKLSMTSHGSSKDVAAHNRSSFCKELGFSPRHLATPKQDHTRIVHTLRTEYTPHTGDGIITNEAGWLLGVAVADCVPLLLYEPETGSYGAIHSGWRGSAENITEEAINKLIREFSARPENIHAWIGPSAGSESYEVGQEVASQFNPKYSQAIDGEVWLFDNKSVVHDQLLDCGVDERNIEISSLDTISNPELHSARRDADESGRMLAAIGISA